MAQYEIRESGLAAPADTEQLFRPSEESYGYLHDDYVAEAAQDTYVERGNGAVWGFCGDERLIALASILQLEHALGGVITSPRQGGIASFGQNAGDSFTFMLTGLALAPDPKKFYDSVGGMTGLINRRMRLSRINRGPYSVEPMQHTSQANELQAFELSGYSEKTAQTAAENGEFCTHGADPHGCAACNGFGAIAAAAAVSKEVKLKDGLSLFEVVQQDVAKVCDGDTSMVEEFVGASTLFMSSQFEGPGYVYGRPEYLRDYVINKDLDARVPIMSLEGTHLPVEDTDTLIGMDAHKKSLSGRHFRVDAAASTLADQLALGMYNIPTKNIIPVKIAVASIIRNVLSGDHGDQRMLPMGVYMGDMSDYGEVLATIEKLRYDQ